MLLTTIIIVTALLVGYCWGKRDGWVEGYDQGATNLTLLLREQSLEKGYCSLCNSHHLKARNSVTHQL